MLGITSQVVIFFFQLLDSFHQLIVDSDLLVEGPSELNILCLQTFWAVEADSVGHIFNLEFIDVS